VSTAAASIDRGTQDEVMSWSSQVWHVFRKDVREQWLLLLAFTVLLVVRAAQPFLPASSRVAGSELGALILIALIAFLAALIVLSDAPTTTRAYWAALPIERSAMWAAKCLMLSAVLTMLALSLVPAFMYLALPVSAVPETLGQSLLLPAAIFIALAGLAGIARNVRAVLFMLLCCYAATIVASSAFGFDMSDAALLPNVLLAASAARFTVLAIGLLGLLTLYRTRSNARAGRLATFSLVVVPALALSCGTRPRVEREPQTVSAARFAGTEIKVYIPTFNERRASSASYSPWAWIGQVAGTLRLDGEPATGSVMWYCSDSRPICNAWQCNDSAQRCSDAPLNKRIPIRTGITSPLDFNEGRPASFVNLPMAIAPTPRWLGRRASDSLPRPMRNIPDERILTPAIHGARATDSAVYEGRLELWRERVVADLRLTPGDTDARNGRRTTVRSVSAGSAPRIEFEMLAFADFNEVERYRYVLWNEQRREALELFVRFQWQGAFGLPASPRITTRVGGTLETVPEIGTAGWIFANGRELDFPSPGTLSDDWMRAARLFVVQRIPTVSAPFSAEYRPQWTP
jgi:hypothetical protein